LAEEFAEVIVNKAVDRVDRVFHYRIPGHLRNEVALGSLVSVPFGSQELEGVVVGLTQQADCAVLKEISAMAAAGPMFHADLLQLAVWMADYYLCPRVSVLKAMLPAGLKLSGQTFQAKTVQIARLAETLPPAVEELPAKAPAQAKIIACLREHGAMDLPTLLAATGATRSAVSALAKKGFLQVAGQQIFRDPQSGEDFQISQPDCLTSQQERALREIAAESAGQGRAVLLHGITGSGKTEIYLSLVQRTLAQGRQAIVLVPEIGLTPQTAAIFKARLGQRVAVLHSGLSGGEKRDAWLGIAAGRISVVVGARSAIFAPCPNLGLIVVDEEHELSYKQDNNPRFHAREVALERGRLNQAQVVMGSATPSIEAYTQAQRGDFCLVTLGQRVFDRPLPQVEIVDMRQELRQGNRSIFSRLLQEKLAQHLAAGDQALLFLNRRGYHTFVSCRSCGHALTCPHCAISLTHHGHDLKCHYCGFSRTLPERCPECGSGAIRHFGVGTQRVEDEIRRLFPLARVARADTDTMSRKGAYERVFSQMRRREVDILVGTQMVSKGLDFPGVTLVGIIAADMSLNLPEMRAAERTFQLITQVSGRAGRGKRRGEVVLQTYSPDDPSILASAAQDYQAFYSRESGHRQAAGYPPFGTLIRLVFTGPILAEVERAAEFYARLINAELTGDQAVLGPAPAPLAKIKDRFRVQLFLKGPDLAALRRALKTGLQQAEGKGPRRQDVSVAIDVEPLNMM